MTIETTTSEIAFLWTLAKYRAPVQNIDHCSNEKCGAVIRGDRFVELPAISPDEDTLLLCPGCALDLGMTVCGTCGQSCDFPTEKCPDCHESDQQAAWERHLEERGYRI